MPCKCRRMWARLQWPLAEVLLQAAIVGVATASALKKAPCSESLKCDMKDLPAPDVVTWQPVCGTATVLSGKLLCVGRCSRGSSIGHAVRIRCLVTNKRKTGGCKTARWQTKDVVAACGASSAGDAARSTACEPAPCNSIPTAVPDSCEVAPSSTMGYTCRCKPGYYWNDWACTNKTSTLGDGGAGADVELSCGGGHYVSQFNVWSDDTNPATIYGLQALCTGPSVVRPYAITAFGDNSGGSMASFASQQGFSGANVTARVFNSSPTSLSLGPVSRLDFLSYPDRTSAGRVGADSAEVIDAIEACPAGWRVVGYFGEFGNSVEEVGFVCQPV